MEFWSDAGLSLLGLVVLLIGAELLVRGAVRLALAAGVSALVVGLTVVAYGTSAPELAVNVTSGISGHSDVAIGNVAGSNILNILLILGLSALIAPLTVARQLVRVDVPIMIASSILVWAMAADGVVGLGEGAVLFLGIIVYTVATIILGRRQVALEATSAGPAAAEGPPRGRVVTAVALVVLGLVMLGGGTTWFVQGATGIARALGVSELLIALTIIAGGTSLPEAATSIVAALRGERDIAVGNVVGSCIFNNLMVLGGGALAAGASGLAVSPVALSFDIPVMVAAAVACLPVFFTGARISRLEGVLFFLYYIAYVGYLVLHATSNAAREPFGRVMLAFVLPLTAVGLAGSFIHGLRRVRPS